MKTHGQLESGLTHLLAGSGLVFFLVFSGLISVIRTLKKES